ncbi:MAG: twin-arginine translocase TatA/TatE family subunit [Alphaproteobacteria bacterium]
MFGKFGVTELIIILVIVLVIFGGRGKISAIMGDVGSGLKAFKKSVKDDEEVVKKEASEVVENVQTELKETTEEVADIVEEKKEV